MKTIQIATFVGNIDSHVEACEKRPKRIKLFSNIYVELKES